MSRDRRERPAGAAAATAAGLPQPARGWSSPPSSSSDQDGKPIEGLTAKDFVVTEDNEPQEIAFVEFQRLDRRARLPGTTPRHDDCRRLPAPAAAPPRRRAPAGAGRAQRRSERDRAADSAATSSFRNRRLIILFFDQSATSPPDQMRIFDAALKYISGADAAGRIWSRS